MIRLTFERLRRQMSKAELARASRLDQALVSKFESGRVRPYPAELHRLAVVFEIPDENAKVLLEEVNADARRPS